MRWLEEKAMATDSSVLAWRIPGVGEPGGLHSMGSHRVGHNWSNLAAAAAAEVTGSWISLDSFRMEAGDQKDQSMIIGTFQPHPLASLEGRRLEIELIPHSQWFYQPSLSNEVSMKPQRYGRGELPGGWAGGDLGRVHVYERAWTLFTLSDVSSIWLFLR